MINIPETFKWPGLQGLFDPQTGIVALNAESSRLVLTENNAWKDEIFREVIRGIDISLSNSVAFDLTETSGEKVLAISTFLHETTHWWQYAGSSLGLFLSILPVIRFTDLFFDIQNQQNLFDELLGIKQVQIPWIEELPKKARENWHSKGITRMLFHDPNLLNMNDISLGLSFSAVEKCMKSAFRIINRLEKDLFSKELRFTWKFGGSINKVRDLVNYLDGLNLNDICESQSAIIQFQYLNSRAIRAGGQPLQFADFEKAGLFSQPYRKGLNYFLNWAQLDAPKSVNSPIVFAYLAVCDISINPNFFNLDSEENFEAHQNIAFEDFHPLLRFKRCCEEIKTNPEVISLVNCELEPDLESYLQFTKYFCEKFGWAHPTAIAKYIYKELEAVSILVLKKESNWLAPVHLLLVSTYFLCRKRIENPESMCWLTMYPSEEKMLRSEHFPILIYDSHTGGVRSNYVLKEKIESGKYLKGTTLEQNSAYSILNDIMLEREIDESKFDWIGYFMDERDFHGGSKHNLEKALGIVRGTLESVNYSIDHLISGRTSPEMRKNDEEDRPKSNLE